MEALDRREDIETETDFISFIGSCLAVGIHATRSSQFLEPQHDLNMEALAAIRLFSVKEISQKLCSLERKRQRLPTVGRGTSKTEQASPA